MGAGKKKEKKYTFVPVIKCAECGAISTSTVPCEDCGKMVFKQVLELREIE